MDFTNSIAASATERMSCTDTQTLDTTAFKLLVALERYEAGFDELLKRWGDPAAFRTAGMRVDEIRLYSASLPTTTVQFVALLISRAELLQCLWQLGDAVRAEELARCAQEHEAAIAALRQECLHVLACGEVR